MKLYHGIAIFKINLHLCLVLCPRKEMMKPMKNGLKIQSSVFSAFCLSTVGLIRRMRISQERLKETYVQR